jgi:hypothetical protein
MIQRDVAQLLQLSPAGTSWQWDAQIVLNHSFSGESTHL